MTIILRWRILIVILQLPALLVRLPNGAHPKGLRVSMPSRIFFFVNQRRPLQPGGVDHPFVSGSFLELAWPRSEWSDPAKRDHCSCAQSHLRQTTCGHFAPVCPKALGVPHELIREGNSWATQISPRPPPCPHTPAAGPHALDLVVYLSYFYLNWLPPAHDFAAYFSTPSTIPYIGPLRGSPSSKITPASSAVTWSAGILAASHSSSETI